jgi:hypothetical protein
METERERGGRAVLRFAIFDLTPVSGVLPPAVPLVPLLKVGQDRSHFLLHLLTRLEFDHGARGNRNILSRVRGCNISSVISPQHL